MPLKLIFLDVETCFNSLIRTSIDIFLLRAVRLQKTQLRSYLRQPNRKKMHKLQLMKADLVFKLNFLNTTCFSSLVKFSRQKFNQTHLKKAIEVEVFFSFALFSSKFWFSDFAMKFFYMRCCSDLA